MTNFVIPRNHRRKIRVFNKYTEAEGWSFHPESIKTLDNRVHVDIYCGYPIGRHSSAFLIELDCVKSFDLCHELNEAGLDQIIHLIGESFVSGIVGENFVPNTRYLVFRVSF